MEGKPACAPCNLHEWCQANWPAIPDVWPASVPQGQQLPGDLVDEGKLLLFMKEKGKRVADERKRHLEAQEAKRAVKRRRAPSAHHTNTQLPPADTIVVGGGGSEYESDSDLELYESTLKLQYNTVRGYVSAIQKLYDEQKSRESILRPGHRDILATTWSRKRKEYMDRGVGTLRDVYAPAQIPDHTNVAWSERREIACALRTQVDFLLGNHMLLRSGNRLPMELADCFPLDLPNEGFKAQGYTTKALVVVMNCGKTNQHGRMEYGSALRHRDPRSCLIGALAFWLFWRWQVEKAERFPVFQRSEDWYETKVLRRSAKEPQGKRDGIHRNPITQRVHRPFHSPNIQLQWTSRFYKKAGIKVSKWMKARHVICPRQAANPWPGLTGTIQIRRADDRLLSDFLPFEFMRAVADFDPEWSGSYFVPRPTSGLNSTNGKRPTQNMAAGAFLELLEWLREVLLQDAVFLRESYPDHPIFQDPVFSCPEFEAFASKTAIPRSFKSDAGGCGEAAHTEQLAERRHLDLLGASYELCTKLDEFAQATYTVTFSPGQDRGSSSTEAPRSTRDGPQVEIGPSQAGGKPQGRAHGEPPGPREHPSFKLPELLRLWRQGWGEMPSVDSLERDWEKNYLSTRKIIVDEVRRRAQSDGLTEDIVARQMDEERGPSSLDKLFKAIRKDRQGEKGHKRASGQFNVGGSEKSMEQMTRTLAAKVPQAVRGCVATVSGSGLLENASNHRNLATDRMLSSRTGFLVVGPGFRALWRSEDDINPAEPDLVTKSPVFDRSIETGAAYLKLMMLEKMPGDFLLNCGKINSWSRHICLTE
ncbi:centromere DNA-binding protein complex CBF3 subunit, domain 2 domain-containing protein [Hirsutella rhossiliensis]